MIFSFLQIWISIYEHSQLISISSCICKFDDEKLGEMIEYLELSKQFHCDKKYWNYCKQVLQWNDIHQAEFFWYSDILMVAYMGTWRTYTWTAAEQAGVRESCS